MPIAAAEARSVPGTLAAVFANVTEAGAVFRFVVVAVSPTVGASPNVIFPDGSADSDTAAPKSALVAFVFFQNVFAYHEVAPDALEESLRKTAEKPRSPTGITREKFVPGPVVERIVIVPAQVADSSTLRIRSTVESVENVISVVPVNVFVSLTTEPPALRPWIVTVCVVSPAAEETAWIVSFAVIWVKSGRRSVSIAPPTAIESASLWTLA